MRENSDTSGAGGPFPFWMRRRFLLVLFWTVLSCIPSWGQPEGVHLSLSATGKGEKQFMTVLWYSRDAGAVQFIRYGLTEKELPKMVKADSYGMEGSFFHKGEMTKLTSSTRYYYQCGSDKSGWSSVFTFVTPPKKGKPHPFTVGIFGDTQNNEFNEQFQKTAEIVGRLAEVRPDLTLHMGDVVNNGSVTADWLSFLRIAQPLAANAPLMLTLGNHDVENTKGPRFQHPFSSFNGLFSLPGKGTDYSFDYGNVHFVCLFSGVAPVAAENGLLRYGPDSEERRWLERDLASARKSRHTDWIIVFVHYPPYSFGWSNVKRWQETIAPIIDRYGVDLCLSGHRHVYERHHPLRNGQPAVDGWGITYVTNGTAGGSPQGTGGSDYPTMAFTPAERMYNYAIMSVVGKSLNYEVFDSAGEKTDEFELNSLR